MKMDKIFVHQSQNFVAYIYLYLVLERKIVKIRSGCLITINNAFIYHTHIKFLLPLL